MLWLWYRPAVLPVIQPLAGEPPYAAGVALKSKKKKKEEKKKECPPEDAETWSKPRNSFTVVPPGLELGFEMGVGGSPGGAH